MPSDPQAAPWRHLRGFRARVVRWRRLRTEGIAWPVGMTSRHPFYQRRWQR